MKVSIKLANGQIETKIFSSPSIVVGRSDRCDFVVKDESLSRQHCQIELDHGSFYITDLGSSNGVFLDGHKIPAHTRTPFTTFLQLTIGSFDCHVDDADETAGSIKVSSLSAYNATPSPASYVGNEASGTKTKKTINQQALNTPFSTPDTSKTNSKKNAVSPLTILAVFVVLAGGYYQFAFVDSEKTDLQGSKKIPDEIVIEKNVPEKFRSVQDHFLTQSQYRILEDGKNCEQHAALCKELALLPEQGEGLVEKDGEFYLFIQPHAHANIPRASEAAKGKTDFMDIVALYTFINSSLMERFQSKSIAQVHVLVKNQKLNTRKVYRFHVKYFTNSERFRLLTDIGVFFDNGDSRKFWTYAKPIIKVLEF